MRFRRRLPAVDDGLLSADELRVLLAAAAKRNLALERTVAVQQSAVNRSVDGHRLFCTHAAQLVETEHELAETKRYLAAAELSEKLMHRRLRAHLAALQNHNTATTQPIQVIASQEPR